MRPVHGWVEGLHRFRGSWRRVVPTGARTVVAFGVVAGRGVPVRWATRSWRARRSPSGRDARRGCSWSPPSVSGAGAVDRVGDVDEVMGGEFDVRCADPAVDLAGIARADDRGGDPLV